jgi:hypothetical protein
MFGFRLCFHIPLHLHFESTEAEVTLLQDEKGRLWLRSLNAGVIKTSHRLGLCGEPYATIEEAFQAGRAARLTLIEFAIHQRFAVAVGAPEPPGGVKEFCESAVVDKDGTAHLDGIHGLAVYDASRPTKFWYGNDVNLLLGRSEDRLRQEVGRHYPPLQLTEKQEIAYELFAASQFEVSQRSRFLSLMLAVESLLEPRALAPEAQQFLELLLAQIAKSSLTDHDKKSMKDKIKFAAQESIRQCAKRLTVQLLGKKIYLEKEAGAFFLWLYDVRSELVHNGKISKKGGDLPTILNDVEQFVADLLDASIAKLPNP